MHLTGHRRSWSQHRPHFHAASQRRPSVSRETEGRVPTMLPSQFDGGTVTVSAADTEPCTGSTLRGHGGEARRSQPGSGRFPLLGLSSARAPARGKGSTPSPNRLPEANPLSEVKEALVRARAYFTTVPGNAPTSVSDVTALEAPRSHDAAQHSLLSAADRSPSSTCLNNDVQPSVHVFHVKPGLPHFNHNPRHLSAHHASWDNQRARPCFT